MARVAAGTVSVALAALLTPAAPAAAGTHVTFSVTPGPLWVSGARVTDTRGTDLGYRVDVAGGTVSVY